MKRILAVSLLGLAATRGLAAEAGTDTVKFAFAWPTGLAARVEMASLTTQSTQSGTAESSSALHYRLQVASQDDALKVQVDDFQFDDDDNSGKPGFGDLSLIGAVVPAYRVSKQGEYVGIVDPKGTHQFLRDALLSVLSDKLSGERRKAAERVMDTVVTEAMLDQFVGDQWNIMVGSWTGSEPELGETYESTTDEPTAALPGAVLRMNHEFRVLRRLPCARGGQQKECVETTLISTVDPEGGRKLISQVLGKLNSALGDDPLRDASMIVVRRTNLVTEPDGMIPHSYTHEELVTLKTDATAAAVTRNQKRTVTFTYE